MLGDEGGLTLRLDPGRGVFPDIAKTVNHRGCHAKDFQVSFESPKVKSGKWLSQKRHKNVTDAKMGQQMSANPLKLLARDTGFEPVTSASGGR